MKQFIQLAVFVLLCTAFLSGCRGKEVGTSSGEYKDIKSEPPLTNPIEGYKSYRFPGFPVRVQYPGEWEKKEDKIGVAFIIPEHEYGSDVIQGMTILVDRMYGKKMSLEEYKKPLVDDLKKRTADFRLFETGETILGTSPAYKLIYGGKFKGLMLRYLSVFCLKDDLLCVISFSAVEAQYEKYSAVADRIASSFEFF
jgi:hypothetical protein